MRTNESKELKEKKFRARKRKSNDATLAALSIAFRGALLLAQVQMAVQEQNQKNDQQSSNSTGRAPLNLQDPTAAPASGRPNYLETGRQITGILDRFMSLGYDKRVRPNYGGPPVKVNVTMRILSISSVSEVMMDFTADFYFRQTWQDPRLSFKKLGDIQTLYVGAEVSKKIWLPDTFFGNEKMAYFHEATTPNVFLRIDHSGEVYRSIRLTVTSSCPMNLQYFPMDRQRCTIEAESYGYNVKDIIYHWARKDTAVERDKEISLPQFDIVRTVQKYRREELSSGTYSRLIAEIHFARRMGYYLIQIYIPSSLIVVISWVSFWLHRNASPARVQLGVTTVLTMTTLMSSTNAALPKISYVKSIDIFLGTCFVMVFAALLEYATVGYLGKRIAMRKSQAQHAQAQANARLLAQLQAVHGGQALPPHTNAIAAAAATAMSLNGPSHTGGNLFSGQEAWAGGGGVSGQDHFGGHTAGAQSSPLSLINAGAIESEQDALANAMAAAMADQAQAQARASSHRHTETTVHRHKDQQRHSQPLCHEPRQQSNHHHFHYSHCDHNSHHHNCHHHQHNQHQQQHDEDTPDEMCPNLIASRGAQSVCCQHMNTLPTRSCTKSQRNQQQAHREHVLSTDCNARHQFDGPMATQRCCTNCPQRVPQTTSGAQNKIFQTLPRNITFAGDDIREFTPIAPPRNTNNLRAETCCNKHNQQAKKNTHPMHSSPLLFPPAYLPQSSKSSPGGGGGAGGDASSSAAKAAAAQFVNLHRRNKGLPPSTNPNFANFNAANSPFVAPYNRALETIFGIRPSDIDKYSRVVFPVCFVCFQLMYWIVYLHISAFLESDKTNNGQETPITQTTSTPTSLTST